MAIARKRSGWLASAGLASLAALVMGAGGCNRRTIEIGSEPGGALVRLNDVEVGRTPLEVDFTYYGVYDVRLSADGYMPLATSAEAVAPWYEYPGPDLVTSMTRTHVVLKWNFVMVPLPSEKANLESELVERAKTMRAGEAQLAPVPALQEPAPGK